MDTVLLSDVPKDDLAKTSTSKGIRKSVYKKHSNGCVAVQFCNGLHNHETLSERLPVACEKNVQGSVASVSFQSEVMEVSYVFSTNSTICYSKKNNSEIFWRFKVFFTSIVEKYFMSNRNAVLFFQSKN